MNYQTNFHSHNYLCRHAEGTVEDYIKKAIELKFTHFGLSDHCYHPESLSKTIGSARMSKDEFENIYLQSIRDCKIKYKDEIKIYAGLEVEYMPELFNLYDYFKSNLDYMVLGEHYSVRNGHYYGLLNNEKFNSLEVMEKYTDLVVKGLNTGLFSILAHPDLFLVYNPNPLDKNTEKLARRIIEACIKNNVLIEVNANGARTHDPSRCKLDDSGRMIYGYPNYYFFKLVQEYKDAKVVIDSDCHLLKCIKDEATDYCMKMVEELKLNLITEPDFTKEQD